MKFRKRHYFLFAIVIATAFFCIIRFCPDKTLSAFMNRQYSTRFYDTNSNLIYIMPLEDGLRREYYQLKDISPELVRSFIQEEDKNFYRHCGIDFLSIIRALVQNRRAGRIVSGASTITMQLSRIIWPRKGKATVTTKAKEAVRAVYLEIKLSKDEILELYLNSVPFGFQVEGVVSAARSFFSTDAFSLTPEQCAALAKIPRRPTEFAPQKTYSYPARCPHFVAHVIESYKRRGEVIPPDVTLSVDSALTEYAELLIQQRLEEYKEARIHNGAAFAINNKTGEVLIWAGNASFHDSSHAGQIDGVTVKNQPGSSMKPFLYALALERGFSPTSVLPDIQQDFGSDGVYVPLNFNNRYNGPVRFRVALASSLNIPAVYLLHQIGLPEYMEQLYKLGFDSLKGTEKGTGLSLALGSSEVTLEEMVRAFSVFVNNGVLLDIRYTKLMETNGNSGSTTKKPVRVYQKDTAHIMCDILTDESARSLGFGHASVFDTPYPSIFKTGTSNQFQNIIALGATPEYTAGVWMGNFEGQTVIGQTGSSIPAKVVRALLDELVKQNNSGTTAAAFRQPTHYHKRRVCALSGMQPADCCPSVVEEYVKDGEQLAVCNWHYAENGRIKIRYPSEYQHWADSANFLGNSSAEENKNERNTALTITYPRNGAVFVYDASLPSHVQALVVTAVGGESRNATLYVDGSPVGTASNVFRWNIPLSPGDHTLAVTCGTEKAESYFKVK